MPPPDYRALFPSRMPGATVIEVSRPVLGGILSAADFSASVTQFTLGNQVIRKRLRNRLDPATVILNCAATATAPTEERFTRRVVGTQSDGSAVSGSGIGAWSTRTGIARGKVGRKHGSVHYGAATAILSDRALSNRQDESVPG